MCKKWFWHFPCLFVPRYLYFVIILIIPSYIWAFHFFSSLSPHFKPRQFKSFTCFIRRCWLCTDYEWWAGIDIMKWGQHLWPNAHRNRRKCWWSIPIVFLFQHITFMTGEGLGEAWWGDSVNIPIAMLSVLRQKWGWGIWRTVFW